MAKAGERDGRRQLVLRSAGAVAKRNGREHEWQAEKAPAIVDSEVDNADFPVHRAIRRFFSRQQDVRLTLEIGTPDFLDKALQTGEIQVAVGPFPKTSPNIDYKKIYVEEHALYCGVDHPLFSVTAGSISASSLAKYPMTIRPYLQRAELAVLQDAIVNASVSSMEAQAILIRSGCFLGFLPLHYAERWVKTGQMRQIDLPGLNWLSQFYVATRTYPEPTEVAQVFVGDFMDELAEKSCSA